MKTFRTLVWFVGACVLTIVAGYRFIEHNIGDSIVCAFAGLACAVMCHLESR